MAPVSNRRLIPLPVPAGAGVLGVLGPLRDALSGAGPALLPHDDQQRPPAALRPDEPLDPDEDDPDDPTVAVVTTSGSTGHPKGALLTASALLASASATHDRLGGPGHWLLALRGHHVAGLQVLVRSLVARTVPTVLDLSAGFHPSAFVEAAAASVGGRRYCALVPTQLVRLLAAGGSAVEALAGFDAVLIGGAAAAPALLQQARVAGISVVTTYGMSETCGGCVYDQVPLAGVQARTTAQGRVWLAGPVLARGYRRTGAYPSHDAPTPPRDPSEQSEQSEQSQQSELDQLDERPFQLDAQGVRWFRTDDAGVVDPHGRLHVSGRLDDAVVTGGLTVAPAVVEAVLHELPGVLEAVVLGLPDPLWGHRVVAVLVLGSQAPAPTLDQVRAVVGARVEPAAAPRQVLVVDQLPLRGPGKPDRIELARLATAAASSGSGTDLGTL